MPNRPRRPQPGQNPYGGGGGSGKLASALGALAGGVVGGESFGEDFVGPLPEGAEMGMPSEFKPEHPVLDIMFNQGRGHMAAQEANTRSQLSRQGFQEQRSLLREGADLDLAKARKLAKQKEKADAKATALIGKLARPFLANLPEGNPLRDFIFEMDDEDLGGTLNVALGKNMVDGLIAGIPGAFGKAAESKLGGLKADLERKLYETQRGGEGYQQGISDKNAAQGITNMQNSYLRLGDGSYVNPMTDETLLPGGQRFNFATGQMENYGPSRGILGAMGSSEGRGQAPLRPGDPVPEDQRHLLEKAAPAPKTPSVLGDIGAVAGGVARDVGTGISEGVAKPLLGEVAYDTARGTLKDIGTGIGNLGTAAGDFVGRELEPSFMDYFINTPGKFYKDKMVEYLLQRMSGAPQR